MPHQCTNCGHVFADGSKEMLSGCPDCGGNKFQYHPGEVPDEPPTDAEPPEREGGSVTGAVGRAANKVRDAVSSDPDPSSVESDAASEAATADGDDVDESEGRTAWPGEEDASVDTSPAADADVDASESVDAGLADHEDSAQATARSEVVDRNSLPDTPEGRVVKEPDSPDERPDLEDLREELNDQFESIRIVAPGQYELNLMELYDRQEYIIALQEDGQYVIEVPDAWDAPESSEDY
ncbi:Zn-ribbon domain-containing protein [Halobacterium wangiae]|uniref:Zn-ribbon domain-containing protein n=1 Tax=Halobacterium wangiae TaxID=2902623 RepID=UPI001E5DFFDE|nr:Zn-ribbon domain-containing protein [Halobacterium wangiae]